MDKSKERLPAKVTALLPNKRCSLEFHNIMISQTNSIGIDADVEYALALEAKLESDYHRNEEAIEVDSENGLYRVWRGMTLIGTYYRCLQTKKWVAEPRYFGSMRRYKTAQDAEKAIIKPYNQQHTQVVPKTQPCDEWDADNDPAYSIWDVVKVIDESTPHSDWKEQRICALDLYMPLWNSGTPMDAPEWRYGCRNLRGTGELKWFTEEEITKAEHAHLISFESEF